MPFDLSCPLCRHTAQHWNDYRDHQHANHDTTGPAGMARPEVTFTPQAAAQRAQRPTGA